MVIFTIFTAFSIWFSVPKTFRYFILIVSGSNITSVFILVLNMLAPERRSLLYGLRNFQINHVKNIFIAVDCRILIFTAFNLCISSQIKITETIYYNELFESFYEKGLIIWFIFSLTMRFTFGAFG